MGREKKKQKELNQKSLCYQIIQWHAHINDPIACFMTNLYRILAVSYKLYIGCYLHKNAMIYDKRSKYAGTFTKKHGSLETANIF